MLVRTQRRTLSKIHGEMASRLGATLAVGAESQAACIAAAVCSKPNNSPASFSASTMPSEQNTR